MGDEGVPGLAAGLDDRVAGVEDAIGEVVLAQMLPDVFDRIELWGIRRERRQADVVRHFQLVTGWVPASSIQRHDGVRAGCDGGIYTLLNSA